MAQPLLVCHRLCCSVSCTDDRAAGLRSSDVFSLLGSYTGWFIIFTTSDMKWLAGQGGFNRTGVTKREAQALVPGSRGVSRKQLRAA